jgi:transposase-like protein
MTGRKWTAEEKLAIVLEGIKRAKPVADICREHRLARDRTISGETASWRAGRAP